MENDAGAETGNTQPSASSYGPKSNVPKMGINLLKRSKHDLLRLLSILEGELEARDIYISTLEARLNNQRNAKNQYFVHRLNDPFLSLHRDDYMFNAGDQAKLNDELTLIEPLPLLDKVVSRFKSQQQKMHHQMALASKIHRKMAHELAEEKRKHSTNGRTDGLTLSIEEERERFNARIMCERERTKRIEKEYRKLLSLCKREGKRHKMIVISLLMEREILLQQLNQSKELQIDKDATEPELQARLQEALQEKQELTLKVQEEQTRMDELKAEFQELEEKVWKHFDEKAMSSVVSRHSSNAPLKSATEKTRTALQQASALYSCDDEDSDEDSDDDDSFISAPKLPLKMGRTYSAPDEMTGRPHRTSNPETAAFFSKHHPMSVAQSTRDVTLIPTSSHPPILLADGVGVTTSGYYRVKPGSSIAGLDAMKSTATSKEMLSLDFANDDVFKPAASSVSEASMCKNRQRGEDVKSPNISPKTVPPKPNRYVPGTIGYVPFRSPHSLFNDKSQTCIASSPLSGATNFAMNSPNSPNIPQSSPFAINRSMAVKGTANAKPESGKLDQTKKSAAPRITSQTGQHSQFQTTRMKFQNVPTVTSDIDSNCSAKEHSTSKRKEFKSKKSIPILQKATSQSSPRTIGSSALPTVNTAIKTDASSGEGEKIMQPLPPKTKPANGNTNNSNQVRPPPLPPKSPGASSDAPSKRPPSVAQSNKTPEPTFQRKSSSVIKRIAPLTPSTKGNEYSTNGSVGKITKGPTPPTLPAKMSSRHPTPPAGPRQSHLSLTRTTSNE